MGHYDATSGKEWIVSLRDLLIDNWNPSNTGGQTPEIKLITEEDLPRDIRPDQRTSYVLIYEVTASAAQADVYYYGESRYAKVAIDIRLWGRTRSLLIMNEVERIYKSQRRTPQNKAHQEIGINTITWLGWTDLTNRHYKTQWQVGHIQADKAYVSLG